MTRPEHQAGRLCELIEGQKWNAIRFPTLKIQAINNSKIKQQIEEIDQHQWLIFISANAVNFALRANDGKIDPFSKISVIAIGKATEKALQSAGLPVTLVPEQHFNTEGLLATPEMLQISGQSCLIVRGQGGREILADTLKARGAVVEYMEVYSRTIPANNESVAIDQLLEHEKINIITLTSGDALKNLLTMTSVEQHKKLQKVPTVVISDRIKELAEKSGFKTVAVTKEPSDRAIIDTITKLRSNTTWNSQ